MSVDDNLDKRLTAVMSWLDNGHVWDTRYDNWEGIDPKQRLQYSALDMSIYCMLLWVDGKIVRYRLPNNSDAYCSYALWEQGAHRSPAIEDYRLTPEQFQEPAGQTLESR